MGLRSFISELISDIRSIGKKDRREPLRVFLEHANNRAVVTGKLTDLGLLPSTRVSPTEPVTKLGGNYHNGYEQTPSPNLVTYLDDRFPVTPVAKAQEPVWVPEPDRNDDIQRRFEKFNRENPAVYDKLVELALSAKANGHKRLGIKALIERARWYYTIEVNSNESFKINNDYSSRFARKMMKEIPALRGFFRLRELY